MLDTVPKGVTLTDPIAPVPVKPWNAQLSIDSNGNIQLEGNVRVRRALFFFRKRDSGAHACCAF